MSEKVYTKLKMKIPHDLRRFHQSINKDDGEALVKSIRSTCDSMSQTTAQLLELRKDNIKFDNLSEWTQVRGDMLQLYQGYQQAALRNDIEKEESISGRQMKAIHLQHLR